MVKKKILSKLKAFHSDEEGDIAVMCALLLPVMLFLMVYFENEMQVRYVYTQTQTVFDLATRGAAMTGDAVESNGMVFCTIPYDPGNPEFSGDHVAKKLLSENITTLPQYVQDEIESMLNQGKIKGLNDPDLRAGGYVQMEATFKYRPNTPLFFQNYKITVSSTSKCEAEA